MPDKDTRSGTERVEAYLAGVEEPFRSALESLRAQIRAAAPDAEEIITYGIPGVGQDGALVSYCAFKTHCSFFPMSPAVIDALGEETGPWRTAKGTLQFTPDNPLPEALVEKIVQARIAENAARAAARMAKRKS